MSDRTRQAGLAFLVVALCCGCGKSESDTTELRTGATLPSASALQAQRPKRTYFASNENNRCSIYWVNGTTRSKRRMIRCPRSLLPGERLRLAGRTCFREKTTAKRRVPVLCPKQIIRAVWMDRNDAGPQLRPER